MVGGTIVSWQYRNAPIYMNYALESGELVWIGIMHHFIGPKLSRIGLRGILETSYKWCDGHVCLIWTQSAIYEDMKRFICIQNLAFTNIRDWQLSRWHSSTSLQRLLTTWRTDIMLHCCTLLVWKRFYMMLSTISCLLACRCILTYLWEEKLTYKFQVSRCVTIYFWMAIMSKSCFWGKREWFDYKDFVMTILAGKCNYLSRSNG